jgi:hypothetical protein
MIPQAGRRRTENLMDVSRFKWIFALGGSIILNDFGTFGWILVG